MSLNELAESIGSSTSAIHRYESGWDRFELRTLRRLAASLDARLEIQLEPSSAGDVCEYDSLSQLSDRLRPLFWDVDLTTSLLEAYPQWVLRRVLQSGGWEDIRQARRHFGDDAIRMAVQHRSIGVRTRRLWQLILDPEPTPP